MEYVASISYGKDSLAMIEVIKQHGMPLDRIAHVELMATDTISADLPSTVEFKREADAIIKKRYGIEVEHYRPDKTFEEMFYEIPANRLRTYKQRKLGINPYADKIRGFPTVRGHWCTKALKIKTLKQIFKGEAVQYIGIASDEPSRHNQLTYKVRAPLVEHGVTEQEAREICERIGLLAPHYMQSRRSGCWFCPYQPLDELRRLKRDHQDLWRMLLKWSDDSSTSFRVSHNKPITVRDLDERFTAEELQLAIGHGGMVPPLPR